MPNTNEKPAVIIVGSTGLIGSRLVERFAGPYRVFALDIRAPQGDLPDDAEFLEMDVTSSESVHAAMRTIGERHAGPLASVIQLAAYYDFAGEPSELYDKITVQGSGRVLHAARELSLEQFIFSSTMLVHAPVEPGGTLREDQPLEAKWDYPQSKVAAERNLKSEHDDVPVVLLRIAGVYTDECGSLPLSHQIQRIHERRVTAKVYPGDPDRGQAFVHIDDLVEAFRLTVEQRHELPREVLPILIGEPETPGYGDLQREFARLLHGEPDWTTRQIPKAVAKSGAWLQEHAPGIEDPFIKPWMVNLADDHYALDITRARELLGWSPQHRLLDTLPKMIAALQADPEGWYRRHGLEVPDQVAAEHES